MSVSVPRLNIVVVKCRCHLSARQVRKGFIVGTQAPVECMVVPTQRYHLRHLGCCDNWHTSSILKTCVAFEKTDNSCDCFRIKAPNFIDQIFMGMPDFSTHGTLSIYQIFSEGRRALIVSYECSGECQCQARVGRFDKI